MEREQLRAQLDQLNEAINASGASAADKQRLGGLIDDIEKQIDEPQVAQEPQSLADQVESMISTFEAEHPSVASVLNNIMVTLSSMGV